MNFFLLPYTDYIHHYLAPPAILLSFLLCLSELQAGKNGNPAYTLTCPPDQTVSIDPCDDGLVLSYDQFPVTSSVPLVDTFFTPPAGTYLPSGTTTTVTVAGLGTDGNLSACSFQLAVTGAATKFVSCKLNLLVSFDGSCDGHLTPEQTLSGNSPYCFDDLVVWRITPQGAQLPPVYLLSDIGKGEITFKVTNQKTNQSCWGKFTVVKDGLPPNVECPADVSLWCNEPTDPTTTGAPLIVGCLPPEQVAISYFDDIIFFNLIDCQNSVNFLIKRTWSAVDTFGTGQYCVQYIEGNQPSLHDVEFPPDYDGTQLPPIPCSDVLPWEMLADTANTGIPLFNGYSPGKNQFCNIFVKTWDLTTTLCGAGFEIQRFWELTDVCTGEVVVDTQFIRIVDVQPPIFDAPHSVYVSLSGDCGKETLLPSVEISNECSDYDFAIFTPWGTLPQNGGTIEVELMDSAVPVYYVATDACGNAASDTSLLLFENTVLLECPSDRTITCDEYNQELKAALDTGNVGVLSQYGNPVFYANCLFETAETVLVDVDACARGVIERTIKAVNTAEEVTCVQRIEVQHVSGLVVEFPADLTLHCTDTSAFSFQLAEPAIFSNGCENVEVWYEDKLFTVVPDACLRIVRTWYAMNTCVSGDTLDQEIAEDTEFQLGLDLDGDGDQDKRTYRDSWTKMHRPDDAAAGQDGPPDSDPDPDPWDGFIKHEQVIKVIDQSKPVFTNNCTLPPVCITGNVCSANVELPVPEVEDCGWPDLTLTARFRINNTWHDGFGPFSNLAPGTYQVEYKAIDKCYNQTICQTTLTVTDCQAPTAKCRPVYTEEIMPAQTLSIGAYALNESSFDNCPGMLSYSFSPTADDTHREFTCDDVGIPIPVVLWVTDAAGNQDTCHSTIKIIDDWHPCPTTYLGFSGKIETEISQGIAAAEVSVSSGGIFKTNLLGIYGSNTPLTPGETLTPVKDVNTANGVTTFDAVLITRHILGIQYLDSPYKIIAADVNRSHSVTTADVVEIRKLVLGITSAFPNNTSWRFVPKDFVFPEPANPFATPFPESIVYDDSMNPLELHFTGIKTGDVNDNAEPSKLLGEGEERSGGTVLGFYLPSLAFKAGETFALPFIPAGPAIHGFQFALGFDKNSLELQDIVPGFAGLENFGLDRLGEGILKTSWHCGAPFLPTLEQPAFSLVFKAKASGSSDHLLFIEPAVLSSEAYSAGLQTLNVALVFEKSLPLSTRFHLSPNRPNPFTQSTFIGFYLPEACSVQLSLSDYAGRVVKTVQNDFPAGFHEIEIPATDLPAKGLYFYRLSANGWTGQGKMVFGH